MALLAFLGPLPATSQDSAPPAQQSPQCTSFLAPSDSVTVPLYVVVMPHMPGTLPVPPLRREQRAQLDSLAYTLARQITLPRQVAWGLPRIFNDFWLLPTAFATNVFNGMRSPYARIRFGSPAQSALTDMRVEDRSNAPFLDSALTQAIQVLRAAATVDVSRLYGYLQFDAMINTEPVTDYGSAFLDSVRSPVAKLRILRPLSANRLPDYPEVMRLLSEEGTVQMRYLVTADGRVDLTTVRVADATNQEFAHAVKQSMGSWRFLSPSVNGCTFPQEVSQPFTFSMKH
jgi:TonB family protein